MDLENDVVWTREGLIRFLDDINSRDDNPALKLMMVRRFMGKKCVLLNGATLQVIHHPDDPKTGLLKSQLLRMREALRKYSADPNRLTLDEVIAKTGWTRERIAHFRRHCPYLGRAIKTWRAMRLSKGGKLRELTVHDAQDVATVMKIMADREAALATPGIDTISMKQARQRYRISPTLIRKHAKEKGRLPTVGRGRGFQVRYDAAQVAAAKQRYEQEKIGDVPPLKDEDGIWWPTKKAAEIAGCSSALLWQMLRGDFRSPPGVKFRQQMASGRQKRRQGYWLEGPLHKFRKARGMNGPATPDGDNVSIADAAPNTRPGTPKVTLAEAIVATRAYLPNHPNATIKEVAAHVGCSVGLIAKTSPWKAFAAGKKGNGKPKTIHLSDKLATKAVADKFNRHDEDARQAELDQLIEEHHADVRADASRRQIRTGR